MKTHLIQLHKLNQNHFLIFTVRCLKFPFLPFGLVDASKRFLPKGADWAQMDVKCALLMPSATACDKLKGRSVWPGRDSDTCSSFGFGAFQDLFFVGLGAKTGIENSVDPTVLSP